MHRADDADDRLVVGERLGDREQAQHYEDHTGHVGHHPVQGDVEAHARHLLGVIAGLVAAGYRRPCHLAWPFTSRCRRAREALYAARAASSSREAASPAALPRPPGRRAPAGSGTSPSPGAATAGGRNSSLIVLAQNTTANTAKTGHSNV